MSHVNCNYLGIRGDFPSTGRNRAGLPAAYIGAVRSATLGTLGKLAYAISTPGVAPSDVQINTFLDAMRPGIPPTVADVTAMKPIVFEAQTLTIANLRSSLVATDDSAAKKVAPAERSARIIAQKLRLHGLTFGAILLAVQPFQCHA